MQRQIKIVMQKKNIMFITFKRINVNSSVIFMAPRLIFCNILLINVHKNVKKNKVMI